MKTNFPIKLLLLFSIILLQQNVLQKNLCSDKCSFDDFLEKIIKTYCSTYARMKKKRKFFDTLFNAYSIKFKGLDYEYKKHLRGNYAKSGWLHNRKEKYVKSLPAIAIDEYDSFLDDLSFETCGDENP